MALLLCIGKTTSFPFTFDTTLEQIRKWNLSKQSNEVSSCMIKFFRPHLRRSKIGFANPSSRHQCFLHPAIPPSRHPSYFGCVISISPRSKAFLGVLKTTATPRTTPCKILIYILSWNGATV